MKSQGWLPFRCCAWTLRQKAPYPSYPIGNIDTERRKPANYRIIQFLRWKYIKFSSVNGQVRSHLNWKRAENSVNSALIRVGTFVGNWTVDLNVLFFHGS